MCCKRLILLVLLSCITDSGNAWPQDFNSHADRSRGAFRLEYRQDPEIIIVNPANRQYFLEKMNLVARNLENLNQFEFYLKIYEKDNFLILKVIIPDLFIEEIIEFRICPDSGI